MSTLLDDKDWEWLIRAIKEKRCTPFLGAGMSYGLLPLGAGIAKKWAEEHKYPMPDSEDLIKVSQYMAVAKFPMFPKDEIVQLFSESKTAPNFGKADQPHRILA